MQRGELRGPSLRTGLVDGKGAFERRGPADWKGEESRLVEEAVSYWQNSTELKSLRLSLAELVQ